MKPKKIDYHSDAKDFAKKFKEMFHYARLRSSMPSEYLKKDTLKERADVPSRETLKSKKRVDGT